MSSHLLTIPLTPVHFPGLPLISAILVMWIQHDLGVALLAHIPLPQCIRCLSSFCFMSFSTSAGAQKTLVGPSVSSVQKFKVVHFCQQVWNESLWLRITVSYSLSHEVTILGHVLPASLGLFITHSRDFPQRFLKSSPLPSLSDSAHYFTPVPGNHTPNVKSRFLSEPLLSGNLNQFSW